MSDTKVVVVSKKRSKGSRKGHKPNNAAKRNRERYKAEGRYEKNKRRKAHKEEVKRAKLERKRARRTERKNMGD